MIYWPASWALSVQLDKAKYSSDRVNHILPTLEEASPSVRVDRATLILMETLCLVTDHCHCVWKGGGECFLVLVRFVYKCVYICLICRVHVAAWADESRGLFLFYIWMPAEPSRRSHCGGQDKNASGWKSHCSSQTGLCMALSMITFNTAETAANKAAVSLYSSISAGVFFPLALYVLQVNFKHLFPEVQSSGNPLNKLHGYQIALLTCRKKNQVCAKARFFNLRGKEMEKYTCGRLN